MRSVLFIGCILLSCICLLAKEPEETVIDTIQLQEVIAWGEYAKYQAGAKIESLSDEQISSVQEGGIEQLLMRFTPIYVKSNAGGLATIHIRGTAADHTNIMFGGININSLTLGHSDLSNITSFLFDKLEIQYGSSSALNGSGAIGGAIYLGGQNYWTNGIKVNAKYSFGSFGERLYGAKLYLGNGKWESATKILKYKTDNNFTYTVTSGFGNEEGTTKTQTGAAIDNMGIIQEFNYLFGPNEYFKSVFWYENSWHEIQPNMNEDSEAVTELKDDNIRFWSEYRNENNLIKYSLAAGFVHDKEIYNNDPNQKIQTDRLITDLSMKHPVARNLEYKAGVKYKYVMPDVYSYCDTVNLNEHDAELYLTCFYQPTGNLKATLNLRQQLVSNYSAPFTPAAGLEYNWIKKTNNNLSSLFNISRSYRIPTFNERYWPTSSNPLGTPDLKPEDGFSAETGINFRHIKSTFSYEIKLNLFYMNIKNWIEWRNIGGSVPVNLDRVISKGIELHANASLETGTIISTLTANYTYNPSIKIEDEKPDQQLIYIPRNMFNTCLNIRYKNISLLIDGSFTGKRYYHYISKESQVRKYLNPYFLINCVLSYNFKIGEQKFTGSFAANNIFNISYQNQLNYAMPGINFRASLTANINLKNK